VAVQAEEPRRAAFPAAEPIVMMGADLAVGEYDHELALDRVAEVPGLQPLGLSRGSEQQHGGLSGVGRMFSVQSSCVPPTAGGRPGGLVLQQGAVRLDGELIDERPGQSVDVLAGKREHVG
jgi:hypothetical protein